MKRNEDRILTTHTGSLPRPPELVDLLVKKQHGEPVDEAEFNRIGAGAIRSVIKKQAEAGIDVGNSGEVLREGFFRYVKDRLSGFGGTWRRGEHSDMDRFPVWKAMLARERAEQTGVEMKLLATATGPVEYADRTAIEQECRDFRKALDDLDAPFVESFLSAPSPGIIAVAMRNDYYETQAAYVKALTAAMRVEYETIVRNGFVLQIDAPDLAVEAGISYWDRPRSEFLEFVELIIDAVNEALSDIPKDRVRLHVCWGNNEGPHDQDIPFAEILPIIKRTKVGAFVLPFASPAHAHEFRLLDRLLADDQMVVAGVIDTVTNIIEHPQVVADRLERVAQVVGDPRRVMGGTDCGLETNAGRSFLASDIAWAKLANLVRGARLASERLF